MSDIYLPSLIPPPNCNCRSCKPSLYMFPLHHQQITRVLSASPKPPAIPPQPQFQSSDSLFLSLKTPPPPPRRYQLVPIRNESHSNRPVSDAFTSFGKMACDTNNNNSDRRDYEKTNVICDDVDRMPVIVNAIPKILSNERRKPYYYNELNMLPANDLMQLTSYAEECETNASTEENENGTHSGSGNAIAVNENDELARNTMFNTNLTSCGSDKSLENII